MEKDGLIAWERSKGYLEGSNIKLSYEEGQLLNINIENLDKTTNNNDISLKQDKLYGATRCQDSFLD
jgi:hypothetical protein